MSNTQATTLEKSKTNGSSTKAAEVKTTRLPDAIPQPKPKDLTLEERIRKVQDLTDLIEKRNRFLDAKLKLNSFNLKREETTTKVTISDQQGNQFMTSHTEAIGKILEVLKESIGKGMAETEAKIQF